MVVPGGVFHEVVGDISVFAPDDDALEREMRYFATVFNLTVDKVRADKPLLQEILRQFVAYGDVSRDAGFLGLFVTLDGSVWNWTDATPNDGKSEISLVPVGLQLEEPPVVFEVDDAAGTRVGCSRGRRLSRVVRDDMRWRSAQRRADRRYAKAYYGSPTRGRRLSQVVRDKTRRRDGALRGNALSSEAPAALDITAPSGSAFSGPNYCTGAKPTGDAWDNFDCYVDGVATLVEQAGGDVTMNADGTFAAAFNDPAGVTPLARPFHQEGLCPVNVHWHLGAEHRSEGEFDGEGTGPATGGRKLRAGSKVRRGGRCHHYNTADPRFTKAYDWEHCVDMKVGETYEVHWPHSAFGACGTPNQYQTPFYDGVFCALDQATAASVGSAATGDVPLVSTHTQIGVQAQIFTVVNDEDYYYPDLFRGMIVEGERGTEITGYTGSTTGTTRSNSVCSAYGPITWHVDRKCHLISASSFDKMCADMMRQRDNMSGDLYAHGSREVVAADLVANNKVNLKAAYAHGGNNA